MKSFLKAEGRWVGITAAAVALIFGVSALALGKNPFALFGLLGRKMLLSSYGNGQVLYKATTLIFTGLGCALAFRCGLFNIGAEGQLYVGAFLMTWAGLNLGSLRSVFLIPVLLAIAATGGAAWAFLPGWLKAKRGAHEVITTMMMNFIAFAGTNYLISAHFHMPETIHTAELPPAASLPGLSLGGSPANVSFFLAVALAIGVWYFLWRTPLGFELRAVGANPSAARVSGIPVPTRMLQILLISGAISGLAGMNFILGYKHYFEQGFAANAGFLGIAVALVAMNHPIGVIFSALLFALISESGITLNIVIPKELFEILQGAVIFIVIVSQRRFRETEA
jgi:simple sugar transport system permease protein